MTDHILSILKYGNRQVLAEYFLIITISYIAVIIAIVYIGQRTRIISPLTKSKIMCRQTTGYETIFVKHKNCHDNIKYSKILKKKTI